MACGPAALCSDAPLRVSSDQKHSTVRKTSSSAAPITWRRVCRLPSGWRIEMTLLVVPKSMPMMGFIGPLSLLYLSLTERLAIAEPSKKSRNSRRAADRSRRFLFVRPGAVTDPAAELDDLG